MLNFIRNGYHQTTTRLRVLLIILAAALVAYAAPAIAKAFQVDVEWTCHKTDAIFKELAAAGETAVAIGKVGEDKSIVMSFWLSKTTGTWTVIATQAANPENSCIVLYGTEFTTPQSQRNQKQSPNQKKISPNDMI